ncbi:MAG: prolyl oligopeptidase family serine peptidase [Hydrogenophaga sp.]|jgi:poly(3-hydroxybutyrate) depolymerase|nr:prolyl oligopeptidase family serine peptidase [Hydrogenophaga sp.]
MVLRSLNARTLRRAICAVSIACGTTFATSSDALPTARIDPRQVTVSGVSAGAFMAVQLHVAHSDKFSGVAAVAGGPYLCAEGSLLAARTRCMRNWQPVPLAHLVRRTRALARQGAIAPLTGLAGSRVFLFTGEQDSTVAPAVVESLKSFYGEFVSNPSNVVFKRHPQAGHGMVTQGQGGDCSATAAPFLNDCDLDLAGDLLSHLYPGLNKPSGLAIDAHLLAFDQKPFGASTALGDTGWVYLPGACRQAHGTPCRLHVALHGCRQSARDVGQRFVREAGFNRWAEQNNIVVLYPQTGNAPNGCWDWWGYESSHYATRQGSQVQVLNRMVDKLLAGHDKR